MKKDLRSESAAEEVEEGDHVRVNCYGTGTQSKLGGLLYTNGKNNWGNSTKQRLPPHIKGKTIP